MNTRQKHMALSAGGAEPMDNTGCAGGHGTQGEMVGLKAALSNLICPKGGWLYQRTP